MTRTGQSDDESHPLAALGLTELAERLYGLLLIQPGLSVAAVSQRAGIATTRARDALHELEGRGLAARSAGRTPGFLPASPELALGILLRQREDELGQVRAAIAGYQDTFRQATTARSPEQPVEVVLGREAVVQRVTQLQRVAEHEILVLDKPPYAATERQVTAAEVEHLRRGVRARVIYDRSALEVPGQLAALRQLGEAGERARLIDHLPTKLMIADERYAIVPLGHEEPGVDGLVLVNAGPLLAALLALFESLWRVAIPVARTGGDDTPTAAASPPSSEPAFADVDAEVLTLLAAGLGDVAIARQLGISQSTVQRRLRQAMDRLGARSRVQLVLQAARQGLLPDTI